MPMRSRRIVVVAHCILNANARYVGGARRPGAYTAVIEPYVLDGVGIVQLPCPESSFLGMDRPTMTRDQYDTAAYRQHCREVLRPTVDTLEEFARGGYALERVIGIKGSPSCGVTETTEGFRPTADEAGVALTVIAIQGLF